MLSQARDTASSNKQALSCSDLELPRPMTDLHPFYALSAGSWTRFHRFWLPNDVTSPSSRWCTRGVVVPVIHASHDLRCRYLAGTLEQTFKCTKHASLFPLKTTRRFAVVLKLLH